MTLFQQLKKEIDKGRQGNNLSIPVQYARINEYLEISRHTMYTLAGESGSGKSSLTHDMFIINPIEWYLKNKDKVNVKLSIIYFGMERKMYMYVCKWISRMIFEEYQVYIPVSKILGRKKEFTLTEEEYNLVCLYEETLNKWEEDDLLICHEGSKNPSGISIFLEQFALKHGTITKREQDNVLGTKTYTPHHSNHIVLIITDHIGILAPERDKSGDGQKKNRIDKFSSAMRDARDLYGFSPVIVQQLNRNLSDVQRYKLGDLQPKLSDLADTSSTTQDSDVILALFDPYRHMSISELTTDPLKYDMKKLIDNKGIKYYRSLHLLKSSFSSDGINVGMAFHPQTGIFKSMPKRDEITDSVYFDITQGTYFQQQQESIEQSNNNKKPFKLGGQ